MKQSKSLIFASAFVLLFAFACAPAEEEPMGEEPMEDTGYEEVEEPAEMDTGLGTGEASATLMTADGTEVGTVTFTESGMGVQISADFHDVEADGMHGFHLHENGECSAPGFESAGGHFNPEGVDHACPPTTPRHAGDFGNVDISGGSGTLDQESDLITVEAGLSSVVGRAVILHGGEDDCTSQPSGNAGPRYACGVVSTAGMESMGMEDEGMAGEEMDEGMEEDGGEGLR